MHPRVPVQRGREGSDHEAGTRPVGERPPGDRDGLRRHAVHRRVGDIDRPELEVTGGTARHLKVERLDGLCLAWHPPLSSTPDSLCQAYFWLKCREKSHRNMDMRSDRLNKLVRHSETAYFKYTGLARLLNSVSGKVVIANQTESRAFASCAEIRQ